MFFANAELFQDRVLDARMESPTPVQWLVVAAEPVTSVDVTAADDAWEIQSQEGKDVTGLGLPSGFGPVWNMESQRPRCAAVSAMRRVLHERQTPRLLQG